MKIRFSIAKNGDSFKDAKLIVLDVPSQSNDEEYESNKSKTLEFTASLSKELLLQAKNKLRMNKAARIFVVREKDYILGDELQEGFTLEENDLLVFATQDKEFIVDEQLKQKWSQIKQRQIENPYYDVIGGEMYLQQEKQENQISKPAVIRSVIQSAWLEDEAVKQLEQTPKLLRHVKYAIGMPDLHPGKTHPIGTAIASEKVIYPSLVGGDIGCGMSLFVTNRITLDKIFGTVSNIPRTQIEKLSTKLVGLESPYNEDSSPDFLSQWLQQFSAPQTDFDSSLGTIGGGNHFAELQQVTQVINSKVFFEELKFDESKLFLLVHSGSRGYGTSILKEHEEKFSNKGIYEDSEEATHYLNKHNSACNWARANRHLIAKRFFNCMGIDDSQFDCKIDVWHNNVIKKEFKDYTKPLYLHRKGASPADQGVVVIPGSRGSYSYLVKPTESFEKLEYCGYSLAHGAGRKLKRSKALQMGQLSNQGDLTVTEIGSKVICEDKELLFEEVPEAYKNIDQVIEDLVHYGLVEVIAILKPLITYKTRSKQYGKDKE